MSNHYLYVPSRVVPPDDSSCLPEKDIVLTFNCVSPIYKNATAGVILLEKNIFDERNNAAKSIVNLISYLYQHISSLGLVNDPLGP